jgi:O-antigen/teichoic acid export membrane protein
MMLIASNGIGGLLSDLVTDEVQAAPPPPEWSRPERVFLSFLRFVPGFKHTAASDRVLVALRGSTWTIVGYGASQVVRLLSMVILARHLLGPAAFGLVALVNVFIGGLTMISDIGIATDVIQHRRGDEPEFINTAFLLSAGRGVLLWIVASALAYPFAMFYHQPAIRTLALVAALTVPIQGFCSGSVWKLYRHVKLEKLTILRIASEVFGLLVSIAWAVVSPTAWSLVVGRVATELFFSVCTHFIGDVKVSLKWDTAAGRDILLFGAGMFASSATYFVVGEGERLVVGKIVTLAVLGCFSLALSITSAASSGLQRVISQVFYPMIAASVRTGPAYVAVQYRKARLLLLILTSCMAVIFIIGGNWIVATLLGPKYLAAGWMLQLLGFRAALEVFTSVTTQMLFALGISRYAAVSNLAKLAFLAVGLTIALTKFGFYEALWVLAVAPIAAYLPTLWGIRQNFRAIFRLEVLTFGVLLSCSVVAVVVMRMFAHIRL